MASLTLTSATDDIDGDDAETITSVSRHGHLTQNSAPKCGDSERQRRTRVSGSRDATCIRSRDCSSVRVRR